MPDPRKLKIGDRIKYIARPAHWHRSDCTVGNEDIAFIDTIIRRKYWQRISNIDQNGNRWFRAILTIKNERIYHSWAVLERTGWIKYHKPPNKTMRRRRGPRDGFKGI